uniref:CRISPR system single-strand-specific deoxyribonuclease Cas10/Csm1 (subtype III-A) n=2 Tax=Candidatus Bipolaricaulota TaxID=67810 RepID=H5SNG4_9BACT|nr:CRISPR-associated protein, Csm1 family [uncultured Acetothermia bacterium]BAL59384.1 CRISPR-associated protein Csm1 family [Candidatus Acetothermum autotrophicum]
MIWQAALLHDIGKFRERALGAKHDRQARYTHEAHSQEFVLGLKSFVMNDPLWQALKSAVLRHHDPQYHDELLISAADIIAADERAEAEGYLGETTKHTAPLQSLLARLFDGPERLCFPLKPLALDQATIFAQSTNLVNQEVYKHHWLGFHQEAQRLLPQDWQGLFYLIKKYCWCVPSSATRGEEHDISLFDHLRVTAAITACLEAEGCSEDALKQLRSKDSQLRQQPLFLLLKGDISGIQGFIYTITSKGAAKGLRGRSVYLQLLTEAVARWILRRLDLPFVNLLYHGGGHFMLLLPVNAETKLAALRDELTQKVLESHGTDLYVALGVVPLSAEDFDPQRFPGRWQEAFERVKRAKQYRFSELGAEMFQRVFEPQGQANRTCDICQSEDPRGLIPDEDKEKCHFCKSFEDLGSEVAKAQYLMVTELNREEPRGSGYERVLAQFGYAVKFLPEPEMPEAGIRHAMLYRLNDTDFLTEETLSWAEEVRKRGIESSLGYRCLANVTPISSDGKILDFDELAAQSTGIQRLGILRMDVDNLGRIFAEGVPNATISRIATVSSLVQLFFEGWVHRAADEFKDRIYAIYAGGDDLFFVGAWDATVDLAWKIREDFRGFTGNERVTVSAGIAVEEKKFPLYQAARNAGDALEAAKALPGKNAVGYLGKELRWADFARARDLKEKLVELLQGRDGQAVPRGLLTKLSNVYALYEKYKRQNRPKWTIRLIYDVTRLGEAHKDFKDELQAIQMMIGREGLIGFLDVPVRWAQMLTMTREERGRS